ncbi:MAG: DnaD domain protein [Anaerolineales bacterium]|nr:DnaD domain protein [Anaerolineales bacterium]
MASFAGFSAENENPIRLPETFFRDLLPQVDHLGELVLILHVFWQSERQEGAFHYLRLSDLLADKSLRNSFGRSKKEAQAALQDALERAVQHGALLRAMLTQQQGADTLIFLNSPRGRAAVEAIERGEWRISGAAQSPPEAVPPAPNIYRLYETHIGPLTPMIAEALRDAESTFPADWIEDAFRISVERNKRSWSYIKAILHRWQEGGRNAKEGPKGQQNRRDPEETRQRYAEWNQERRGSS